MRCREEAWGKQGQGGEHKNNQIGSCNLCLEVAEVPPPGPGHDKQAYMRPQRLRPLIRHWSLCYVGSIGDVATDSSVERRGHELMLDWPDWPELVHRRLQATNLIDPQAGQAGQANSHARHGKTSTTRQPR